MGFECGISKVKKIRKDYTLEDFLNVNEYLGWKNNTWNFEERETANGEIIPAPYPTYEKYWNAMNMDDEKVFPGVPKQDEIDFYQAVYDKNKEESPYADASTVINFWCSAGRYFDTDIMDILPRVDEATFGPFNKETAEEALKYVESELDSCRLIPAVVYECFKENPDGTKVLIPCDGIVATNIETHEEKKIYTGDDEYCGYIYVPSDGYEETKNSALTSLEKALIEVNAINFDDELVWYERSW